MQIENENARKVAKDLGGNESEGVDWVAIRDAKMEIVLRYISADKFELWEECRKEPVTKTEWVLDHVAYPSPELVRDRIKKRPVLASRIALVCLELYGNTSEVELGKVEL